MRILVALLVAVAAYPAGVDSRPLTGARGPLFETAQSCMACHNGLTTPRAKTFRSARMARVDDGELRPRSVLAGRGAPRDARPPVGAERDREQVLPRATCRWRNSRREAAGGRGEVFANLPRRPEAPPTRSLRDGVSCTVCHQITAGGLGHARELHRPLRGRYDRGRAASSLRAVHENTRAAGRSCIRRPGFHAGAGVSHPEVGALRDLPHAATRTRSGPQGETIGELPEQVPYHEWRHSAIANERELPGLPHAGDREPMRDRVRARRAAVGAFAA